MSPNYRASTTSASLRLSDPPTRPVARAVSDLARLLAPNALDSKLAINNIACLSRAIVTDTSAAPDSYLNSLSRSTRHTLNSAPRRYVSLATAPPARQPLLRLSSPEKSPKLVAFITFHVAPSPSLTPPPTTWTPSIHRLPRWLPIMTAGAKKVPPTVEHRLVKLALNAEEGFAS